MSKIFALVALLADGCFHSGTVLSQTLEVSRSGIWKMIRTLEKDYGLVCYALKGKGYCIVGGIVFLNSNAIKAALSKQALEVLNSIEILPTIASTNAYLLSKLSQGLPSCSVCLAEHQSQGRGRRGGQWFSPYGRNIMMSFLWRFSGDVMAIQGLTLAIAAAIVRALEAYGVFGLAVKWPNDIYYQGKKIAGILVELNAVAHVETCVVIGIGLNVAMPAVTAQAMDYPMTDVATILGIKPDRNRLVGLLLEALIDVCQSSQAHRLEAVKALFEHYDMLRGHEVTVISGSDVFTGCAMGIDEHGALCVSINGVIKCFQSADVTLKK